ncbi:MAG: protein kinase [Myxococcales bacterium]|nr:protein kinase [Myxococcales bacterium]
MEEGEEALGEERPATPRWRSQPPAAMDAPPPGTVLDGMYRVERVIGRGGMGVVLLATDERLEREVAIKVIAPDRMGNAKAHESFLGEARAMASVRHENVVQLYAYGQFEGLPYFVMEYVPGTDLGTWIDERATRGVSPSIDETLGILDQACRGLGAIHERGVVHADVKPGNVLIGPSFRVAMTDLGLFRALGERDLSELVVGTPAYIAPEVVYSRAPVFDPRADVYAVGVIAYEMLTGRMPLPIEDVPSLFDVHSKRVPVIPPSEVRPELPSALDAVVLRALERDVSQRFSTPDELRRAFFRARSELGKRALASRVLVVDDDDDARAMVSETLRFAFPKAEVTEVRDGAEALAHLERHGASLVVLDLDLPGMNGVELTAALRGIPHLEKVPILVVTGHGGSADWRVLQKFGTDGFLVKPVDSYTLVALARRALDKSVG